MPPVSIRRRRRGGQWQYRGVSDHHSGPGGLQSPRPRRWSLTPRCLCFSRSGQSWAGCMAAPLNALDPRRGQRPSRRDCAARNSRAQGAARCSRSAPPALGAADGLDRASRYPLRGNYRRPNVEVLDDGHRRRYCLIIFAGCSSQPPPHSPMWSMFESAVSDHGSFLTSQTTSWLSLRATSRPPN